MEDLLRSIAALDPLAVYAALAFTAYIENIFPPFPSDVLVVGLGSLSAVGRVSFLTSLIVATVASTLGFLTMYKIGQWFGKRIIESGRLRFLPLDQIHRVEAWFRKYGIAVVSANRFLAGTRAVVSFFVGMSELPMGLTAGLSFLSSLLWNAILLSAGMELGQNWRAVLFYADAYGKGITSLLVVVAVFFIVRWYRRRRDRMSVPPGHGSDGDTLDE